MQERHFKEAFSALSEAVKFKRESWQTWSNYAHAAVQTQNHVQAARGILQVTIRPHKETSLCYWVPLLSNPTEHAQVMSAVLFNLIKELKGAQGVMHSLQRL